MENDSTIRRLKTIEGHLRGVIRMVDEDGFYFFSSRDDDVIIMAGYRIGPFEVESVLSTHPAVAELT